jgi:hypothetical protein
MVAWTRTVIRKAHVHFVFGLYILLDRRASWGGSVQADPSVISTDVRTIGYVLGEEGLSRFLSISHSDVALFQDVSFGFTGKKNYHQWR